MTPFTTTHVADSAEVTAPDGSTVRPLCTLPAVASFAHFALAPGQVSRAVEHATVEEIWYVVGGSGRLWRGQDGREEITELRPGTCLTIPLGTAFQFRGGPAGLQVVAVTAPPWPGTGEEAAPVPGHW
ncbi:cupin domain-containing protein [Amycolatopsis viridis]|uniref:Mannose-6-phosphate isomerase-like protein (Cupin superfamily) n=1 Tax=Amycolatopsis viridis TaxID=185678 RepID=A0ABX0SS93_9PSEU|nr:cupin domain-containing protein [Amycolatopsis viridis]NIH78216.1 mannose-6-phosphate isomerase-like protein (cupin superfamily) [Amycolatopsis viridis]